MRQQDVNDPTPSNKKNALVKKIKDTSFFSFFKKKNRYYYYIYTNQKSKEAKVS